MILQALQNIKAHNLNVDIIIDGKSTLSTFNVTVRSITEKQPERRRPTEEVYGRDGDIDMSQLYGIPTYTNRVFTIVFNIYEELGNRYIQRNAIVRWLQSCEGAEMKISTRPGAVYSGLRIDIGEFKKDTNKRKEKYQSTLTVKITTNPRYIKDGEEII